ncbi:MAG: BTAD domain-containing putative transcriptional regulator [Tumebacillaceae bacterium]
MKDQRYVLSTKLVPPRVKLQCLRRRRLDELFMQVLDYPVTLVQADAGYGKSTALVAHLCSQYDHVAWFSLEEGERDTFLFMLYLIHSFRGIDATIGERSLRLLEEAESTASVLQPCLTLLLNDLVDHAPDPTILVLDDFHTVSGAGDIQAVMDLLVRHLPAHVHLVIGSRTALQIPSIKRLHATFDLLLIDKKELSFSADEIEQLFKNEYGMKLTSEQVAELQEQTEGWIIALQMVWKGLERGLDLPQVWRPHTETGPGSGRRLFHYLAEEVFDRQPEEIQAFLHGTCVLAEMEPQTCDLLLGRTDSAAVLTQLERNGLFVTGVGTGHYRYHRLFQHFLVTHTKATCSPEQWSDLHRTLGAYYREQGDTQQALAHLHEAGDLEQTVELLVEAGHDLLQNGRAELMKGWIDSLPSPILEAHPQLLYWRGEIERVSSRFHEAVHWYTLAEGAYIQKGDALARSRVYRGQAQIFLDTIQPSKAVHWLQLAVHVLGDDYPEETAQLLRLLAENHTNSGQLQKAEELVTQADLLVPNTTRDELDIRIHLRTGRLRSAKAMTAAIVEEEERQAVRGRQRIAKSHREMHLLQSLIDAFLGEVESSRWNAEQGIRIGRDLQSPFVEAVGYIRLGHALVLADELQQAQEYYQLSMKMCEELLVERGKVESFMGLCSTAGLLGELEQAEAYARTGLELALQVEDHWCANLIRLSIGSSWALWGHDDEALPWLLDAAEGFAACGDSFCHANVQLWLAVIYHRSGQDARFAQVAAPLLETVAREGYEHLFLRRALFGPHDRQLTVPFLVAARDSLGLEEAEKLLRALGCRGVQNHPGYTLRVRMLGHFNLHRGMEEVGRKEWKREKSRQLFQLLVTRQGQLLQRDEIYERLWPDVDEKTANRDFKVAMNALSNVLEPKREARSDSFFIERVDTAYRLNRNAAIWVDAHEFTVLAERGLAQAERYRLANGGSADRIVQELEAALHLYQGDFLQHYPYLDWCADERDRLRTLHLRLLETLARLYQERGALQEAVTCCERILAADSCWEAAYQILMNCYHQLGNRTLVMSTYKKCVAQLDDHLGLSPLAETTRLYQRLVRR